MAIHENLSPERLISIAQHRWNIPVIAELERRAGAKYVTLLNCVGAGRGSLSASLAYLIDVGLVQRNPGYGHPMRPEYLLTGEGRRLGPHCLMLAQWVERQGAEDLAYRKWTLPLVVAIGPEVARFSELRAELGETATPRAVTLGLKLLLSAGWAERSLIDDFPPAAGYALTASGRELFTLAAALC